MQGVIVCCISAYSQRVRHSSQALNLQGPPVVGELMLINPHDQLSTTYNCNFHGQYASMAEHGRNQLRLKASIRQQSMTK